MPGIALVADIDATQYLDGRFRQLRLTAPCPRQSFVLPCRSPESRHSATALSGQSQSASLEKRLVAALFPGLQNRQNPSL